MSPTNPCLNQQPLGLLKILPIYTYLIKIIFIKVRSSEIETTCSMGYVITENNSI